MQTIAATHQPWRSLGAGRWGAAKCPLPAPFKPSRRQTDLLRCWAQPSTPAEAVLEGDGAAAAPAPALLEDSSANSTGLAHSSSSSSSIRSSSSSWRSWLPFYYSEEAGTSSSSSSSSFSPSGSYSPAASLAVRDGDGMAAAPPALLESPAAAPTAEPAATPAEQGPLVLVPGSASEAAEAAAEEATGLLLPGGVPLHHPVLQLLRQRALEGSKPGQRSDEFKIGLALEGGGMRGAVNGGALQVLSELGLRDAFDAVYGCSAGALNGAFFVAGQSTGVTIYSDYLCCGKFLSLRRLLPRLRRKVPADAAPALDLSFLIDHVMHSVHPLDWEAVLASPLPLKVVASSLDTLDAVLLQAFRSKEDLVLSLKASATVPELAGGPLEHRGHRLVDAAVFEAVPYRSAVADGCTHVLVLNNLPRPVERSSISGWLAGTVEDAMIAVVKRLVLSPDYMRAAWEAELQYLARAGAREDYLLLQALSHPAPHELTLFGGAHVLPLYPDPSANYSPVCTDVATILAGVEAGRRMIEPVAHALLFAPALDDAYPDGGGGKLPPGSNGSHVLPAPTAVSTSCVQPGAQL